MRPRIDPSAPQHRPAVARGPYVAPVLHDPGVEIGPFRILPRADAKWILYDERQPFGRRTAHVAESQDAAEKYARVLLQTAENVRKLKAGAA